MRSEDKNKLYIVSCVDNDRRVPFSFRRTSNGGSVSTAELWSNTKASSLASSRDTIEFAVIPKQSVTITSLELLVEIAGSFEFYKDGTLVSTISSIDDKVTVTDLDLSESATLKFVRAAGAWNYPYATTTDSSTDVIVTTNSNVPASYWPVVTLRGHFNSASVGSPTWVGNLTANNIATTVRATYSTAVTLSSSVRLLAVRTGVVDNASSDGQGNFYLSINGTQVGPTVAGYGPYCYTPLYEADQVLAAGSYTFAVTCNKAVRNRFWLGQAAGWSAGPFTTGSWIQAPTHGVWMEFLYI